MVKGEVYNNAEQFLALSKKNGFKAGTLYSLKGKNFDWDRASTAYRTNQLGTLELMGANVPRVDYSDGCPKLLIENEATNLILRSQEFDNASWVKTSLTITANAAIAPDGTMTADALTPVAIATEHWALQSAATIGVANTMSVYAKPNGYDWIAILMGGKVSFYNVSNGTLGATNGGVASIKLAENGFYRCIFTHTATNILAYVFICSADNVAHFVGDGTSGGILWGAQLELGSVATSYMPSTTLAATRAADFANNITQDYTSTTGTIFVRAKLVFSGKIQGLFTLSDSGTVDDYLALFIQEVAGDKILTLSTYTNPDQNDINYVMPSDGEYNIAVGYNLTTSEYSLAVNGSVVASGLFVNAVPSSSSFIESTLGMITSNAMEKSSIIGYIYLAEKLDDTSLENITNV